MKKFKVYEVTHCKQDLNDSPTLGTHDGQKIISLIFILVVVLNQLKQYVIAVQDIQVPSEVI